MSPFNDDGVQQLSEFLKMGGIVASELYQRTDMLQKEVKDIGDTVLMNADIMKKFCYGIAHWASHINYLPKIFGQVISELKGNLEHCSIRCEDTKKRTSDSIEATQIELSKIITNFEQKLRQELEEKHEITKQQAYIKLAETRKNLEIDITSSFDFSKKCIEAGLTEFDEKFRGLENNTKKSIQKLNENQENSEAQTQNLQKILQEIKKAADTNSKSHDDSLISIRKEMEDLKINARIFKEEAIRKDLEMKEKSQRLEETDRDLKRIIAKQREQITKEREDDKENILRYVDGKLRENEKTFHENLMIESRRKSSEKI